ncbi:MAG: hypothetical protein FJY29_04420 [Betaproteobacteria bacterium]|nr:hypothetical protein [Betaproteobacteria bacterium]
MKFEFSKNITSRLLALILPLGLAVPTTASANSESPPAQGSEPFMKEVSLIGGVSQASGSGLKNLKAPLGGFIYYRAFSAPQPGKFVLRMLADTVVTQLTPNQTPLAQLEAERSTRAVLVRFGFSGCYVPAPLWLLCMDDGPRVAWLDQGSSNAQVLGSFPLGLSVHSGHAHPIALHLRAEFGWWKSKINNVSQQSNLNLFWLGVGYNW